MITNLIAADAYTISFEGVWWENPHGPEDGNYKVLKGGHYDMKELDYDSTIKTNDSKLPTEGWWRWGFRIARSAK